MLQLSVSPCQVREGSPDPWILHLCRHSWSVIELDPGGDDEGMKPRDEVLGVKIVGGLKEASTPWAGASLFVELFRRSGIDAVANKVLPSKGSTKGLTQGQTVESFLLLSALGGDCIDDMQRLRDDAGLGGILGYQPPAPETARPWLDTFHEETMLSTADENVTPHWGSQPYHG